jgi:hypothetical protein
MDLLLAGQTPFGEILAAPPTPELDGLAACLLDCDDPTRIEQIRARGSESLERVPGELHDQLVWAEWMRHHAADPQWRQDVIREPGADGTRWDRWEGWSSDDPRWRVRIIDTSGFSADRVVDDVVCWIEAERDLLRSAGHPLGATALRHLEVNSEKDDRTPKTEYRFENPGGNCDSRLIARRRVGRSCRVPPDADPSNE